MLRSLEPNDRLVVVGKYQRFMEESVRGTLADVIAHFKETEPRGEFVIVVAGKEKVKSSDKNKANR